MLVFSHLWVFALLPLPLLVRGLLPAYQEPRQAVRAPFFERLVQVSGAGVEAGALAAHRRMPRWAALGGAWLLVLTAMARPVWLEEPVVRELPMRDLLVAVDLSGSMETEDFQDTDGGPLDRLSAARQVLHAFLSRREGDRVGLVFFGSAAFVQAPFTEDLDLVRTLLDEVAPRMLGPRTALGDAMGLAITLFERSEVDQRVLIVLTDGNDTGSLVPPSRAAEIARDSGVVVHTVAMGDPANVGEEALDEATLKQVARITGGGYFRAVDRAALEDVYRRLDALNPRVVETVSHRPETDLYHWPLAATLLLSLGYFALRELRSWYREGLREEGDAAQQSVTRDGRDHAG